MGEIATEQRALAYFDFCRRANMDWHRIVRILTAAAAFVAAVLWFVSSSIEVPDNVDTSSACFNT